MIPEKPSSELASQPTQITGLEIALQWADLPAEHLSSALKALDPQLKREHAYRIAQLEHREREGVNQRAHELHRWGLIAGFILAVLMIIGAVVLGAAGQTWLSAALFALTSSLVALFVLRKPPADKPHKVIRTPPIPQNAPTPDSRDAPLV
ncbi:hypothetical protein ACWDTT_00330 [Streptosporangium sandarakinum]